MNIEQLKAHYQYFLCIKSELRFYEQIGFDQFAESRDIMLDLVRTQISLYKQMIDIVRVMNKSYHLFILKVDGYMIDFLDFVIQGDKELYVMYNYSHDSFVRTCPFEELEVL